MSKDVQKGARRKARELALSALYMIEMQEKALEGGEKNRTLDEFIKKQTETDKVKAYARKIARGVLDNRADIDRSIESASDNWKLNRIARIDRNILRLSVFEMLYESDVPAQASINEAVDLAKKFGSEESSAFVNGVLDRVRKEVVKNVAAKSDG